MNLFTLEMNIFRIVVALYFLASALYIVFFVGKKETSHKIAKIAVIAGFVLHTVAIVVRGIAAHRVPLSNQYEFSTAFAWGIALCFLIFEWKFSFRVLGTFVCPVLFLIIGYAAMQSKEIKNLMPALQSNWLVLHVSCAIISYGAFAVSFGVSVLYLIKSRIKDTEFANKNIPSLEKIDLISYRAVALGFLFLTLVMITGAIWADYAWGHYWSWDPKETWSLVTWIIYAVFLHGRVFRKMAGRQSAIFSVVGFLCVIFTYVGVNTFIPGLHSYK